MSSRSTRWTRRPTPPSPVWWCARTWCAGSVRPTACPTSSSSSCSASTTTRPFVIERLKPIQLSTRNLGPFGEARPQFTRDEWIGLLLRSLGMEPEHPDFAHRTKLLYMLRMVPLVERNYNLVELGPRGTG